MLAILKLGDYFFHASDTTFTTGREESTWKYSPFGTVAAAKVRACEA
jgi:hypothetical protein